MSTESNFDVYDNEKMLGMYAHTLIHQTQGERTTEVIIGKLADLKREILSRMYKPKSEAAHKVKGHIWKYVANDAVRICHDCPSAELYHTTEQRWKEIV